MKRLSRIFSKKDLPGNEFAHEIKAVEKEQKEVKTKIKICTFRVKNVGFNRQNLAKRVQKYEKKLADIEDQQDKKRIQLVQIMSQIEEVDARLEKLEGEKNANIEIKKDKTIKLPLNDAHLEKVKAQLIQANIEKKKMQQERSRALEESSNLKEVLVDLTKQMEDKAETSENAEEDVESEANDAAESASSLEDQLKQKQEQVDAMDTQLVSMKIDLDALEAHRIDLQHQREHLKEQSEMFRFMTEEIDRSFEELLDRETALKTQKTKLEHESVKLSAQVEKVGKYVSSIEEDIGAVHGAMEELSRKKAVFAVELKEALQDDRAGKERLSRLRRQSLEASLKSCEDAPRRQPSTKQESHLTVFANVERIDLVNSQRGTLAVSEDLLLFVPLDSALHHDSFLADIPDVIESEFTARSAEPTLSIFLKQMCVKFINEPDQLSSIHNLIRNFVIEHQSYNLSEASKDVGPTAKHFDIDITPAEHTICTIEEMQKLVYQTPSRLHAFPWRRIYSSSFDGISLKTFYGICKEHDVNDCILLLRDSEDSLLGSFTCSTWSISPHYYGGGDTFVFHMKEGYWNAYRSVGANRYYQFSDESHVSIGQGQCPAIHIDAGFAHGYSQQCGTFNSPPLVPNNDFKISTIEMWVPSYV